MTHILSQELSEAAFKLGSDLAAPGQSMPEVVDELNLNLVTIGCEPVADPDTVRGSWQTIAFRVPSPPFVRALHSATAAIIFRPESLTDSIPPFDTAPYQAPDGHRTSAVWAPNTAVDVGEILKGMTEGVTWVDADAAERRVNMISTNAALLKLVIGGLAANGVKPAISQRAMHQEFDEILDSSWLRTSYDHFVISKVVAKIMRDARLRKVSDQLKDIRRFQAFGKMCGYGLAVQRLLPDDVLVEIMNDTPY